MTIIKQQAVTDRSHQKNLRAYINNDEKVLLRAAQNMEACADIKRWASYMERTRKAFGHDRSSRKGRDGKPAKNTILYHQILGFLPDECSVNGGRLTPEDCMRYAKEYAATYYPNHEVVFALHDEYCKADRTHRFAVHMVVNRSDIVTGRRLDEGRGEQAARRRAARVREMDDRWGLHQVEEGVQNSNVHKRQPGQDERAMVGRWREGRGEKPYKHNLRELCRLAAERAENVFEYRELLEHWGVDTQFRNGRMYATDMDNASYSFSVTKLDADLSPERLEGRFVENVRASIQERGRDIAREREAAAAEAARVARLKADYLAEAKGEYLAYRRQARSMEGTPLKSFPKMRLSRPPEEIAADPDVRRAVLAYWRGADELRTRLSAESPAGRRRAEPSSGSATRPGRGEPTAAHEERGANPRDDQR